MEKLFTRKEAAELLGISITTLDAARNNGLIAYVQYVPNGCVFFYQRQSPGICCQMYAQSKAYGEENDLPQCAKG